MENTNRKRLFIGVLIVLLGCIFLAENLGFNINLPDYLFAWPAIFLALAVVNLLSGNRRAALIMILLSAIFYLQYYDLVDLRTYWPVLLIIFGLSFIFRKSVFSSEKAENRENYFDEIAIFGGIEKKFTSQELEGGKVTSLFGGNEIDLRHCKLKEGASIDVFCMFGGVELLLPSDWKANVEATAIFGGFSDSRTNITADAAQSIRIKGFVMFGGGDIKN